MSAIAEVPAAVAGVDAIRAQFPALARRHGRQLVAYLDGPGGTQVPTDVAAAVQDYLLHHNANRHWEFPTSRETDAAILAAREALADWIGGNPDEIAFGANMTTLTFHLSRVLGRRWEPGDVVVITELEHRANADTWRALARERGLELRCVRMDPATGSLDKNDLVRKLTPGTRLFAATAASNVLGTVTDVRRLADAAHAVGALLFVDAVHYAAHLPPDVRAWDCDFLACSAYKFYGPHVGVLWGRRSLIEHLDAPGLGVVSDRSPERFETGALCHEAIVGAGAAVNFLTSLAESGINRRERLSRTAAALHVRGAALIHRLQQGLTAIPGVRVYAPPPSAKRTPIIAFACGAFDATLAAARLAEHGVFVSHGNFYAPELLAALGVASGSLVRAGCAAYSTMEEMERLLAGVRHLMARAG